MSIFLFYLFVLLLKKLKSEIIIKFKRQNSLNIEENLISYNTNFFANYFITNKFITELYLGEPPQKIPGYLNPIQSGFYLTYKDCPSKVIYNYQNSKKYNLIDKKNYYGNTIHRFSDSLYI